MKLVCLLCMWLRLYWFSDVTRLAQAVCRYYDFTCGNGNCIGTQYLCNGENECGDGSDELICGRCKGGAWKCSRRQCIKSSSRCDGNTDCTDGSDEHNCGQPTIECPAWVLEGTDVVCVCNAPGNSFQNYWQGHTSHKLHLTNVQRHQQGSRYQCVIKKNGYQATKTLTLQVAYPPIAKPVIQPAKSRHGNLRIGDTLTCTVAGGNPLVDSVYFYCRNPHLPDKEGERSETSVSSSVTVHFGNDSEITEIQMTCFCNATWTRSPESYQLTSSRTFQVEYPPLAVPCIHLQATGREVLRTRDKITCIVTGERPLTPLVDSVLFYCSNPDLPDEDDERNTTSVLSSVSVTSVAGDTNMQTNCFCNATWKIQPESYQLSASASFSFEKKAVITRLTMNDRNTTVTVSGSDQATVGLACEAFGRPRPTHVYFTKRGNDSVATHTPRFKVGETDEWTTEATLTLSDVQCTDMGTYNCVADNGVDTPDTRSILLEVRCPPRTSFQAPLSMVEGPISFQLMAFPVPQTFGFIHLGNQTTNPGKFVSPEMFSAECEQDLELEFMVNCTISPNGISNHLFGLYSLLVRNSVGYAEIPFNIPSIEDEGKVIRDSMYTWSIAICIQGVLVIVVIALFICKRRSRARESADSPDSSDSVDYEEIDEYPHQQHIHHQHHSQDRPLPPPPDTGVASPLTAQQQPLEASVESLQSRSRSMFPDAGVPISTDRSGDPDTQEEVEMSDFGCTMPSGNVYDPLQQSGDKEDYMYTDLPHSSGDEDRSSANDDASDLNDDKYHLHPILENDTSN